jgi:hypothetical protein
MYFNHATPGFHRESWKTSLALLLTAFPLHRFREPSFVPHLPIASWPGPRGLAHALSEALEGFARGYEPWSREVEAWCVVMIRWFHAACPLGNLRVPFDLVSVVRQPRGFR